MRPSILIDLEWHLCAEASSAEAAPAPTNGTDTLDKGAPAPAAPLKQGQVAQWVEKQAVAPKRPVNRPASYYAEGDGCQWVLFWAGLFFLLPSYIAVVLPLCSRPRFPTRSDKCAPRLRHCFWWRKAVTVACRARPGFRAQCRPLTVCTRAPQVLCFPMAYSSGLGTQPHAGPCGVHAEQ
jgi:hypothetical protein